MSIHVCKQCGLRFEYCRMCVFRPIRYKDNGFCSKECYEASKNVVEPVIELEPIVEGITTEEVIVNEPLAEPITEETPAETEAETVVLPEVPAIEETTPIIEDETDEYQVHE